MKILLRMLFVVSAISCAEAATAAEANKYDCKGEDVQVRMSTDAYRGRPTLIVTATVPNAVNSPGGSLADVQREDTAMGLSVTGFFTEIADATLAYTLIVPDVVVGDTPIRNVSGMLVRTLAGGLPPPGGTYPHVVQSNTFTAVICDASRILH